MPYPYKPLLPEKKQIRLFKSNRRNDRWKPGVLENTESQWTLTTVSLDDFIRSTPSSELHHGAWEYWSWGIYWALSYAWGSMDDPVSITIDGHSFPISANLAVFIQTFAASPEVDCSAGIWIDQLCINQDDLVEKSMQIQLMGTIYKHAFGTIAWLGIEDNGSDDVIHCLKSLARRAPQRLNPLEPSYDLDALQIGFWQAFHCFIDRPYWVRLWIIQEIVLSHPSLQVMCGGSKISWRELIKAIWLILEDPHSLISRFANDLEDLGLPLTEPSIMKNTVRLRDLVTFCDYYAANAIGLSLMDVLPILRSSEQKNDQDKVYGILSLLDPSISNEIIPDCTLPTKDIFVNFARTCIISTRSLDILLHSGFQLIESLEWPSWVPDWRIKQASSCSKMAGKTPYHASEDQPISCVFKSIDRLQIQGFRIGVIDGLGNDLVGMAQPDAHLCAQSNHDQSHSPYGDFKGIRNALWRTLVANRDYEGRPAPKIYENILNVSLVEPTTQEAYSYHTYHGIFNRICYINRGLRIGGRKFIDYFPRQGKGCFLPLVQEIKQILERAADLLIGRRLITTERGYIGLAAGKSKQGDVIAILFGCSVPVILRPNGDEGWKFIGESYVHGFMDGEAMEFLKLGKYSLESFELL